MDYLPIWQIPGHYGAVAAEQSDIMQPVLRRNVGLLMGWRGMRHARELAAAMGLPENQVSNKLSGRRRWQMEDLPVLASSLGIEVHELLMPLGQLAARIAAIDTATGTDTPSGGVGFMANSSTNVQRIRHPVEGSSQVIDLMPKLNERMQKSRALEACAGGANHATTA